MEKKTKIKVAPPSTAVFHPWEIECKNVEMTVLMLQCADKETLTKACDSLYKFAQKDENKVTLLGLGAVKSLSKLISHEDKTVRRNAVMVCGIMASRKDVRKKMRKLKIVPSLIARLVPEEEVVVHEFATLCLSHLAIAYSSKARIFELNGLEHLIRLLGSPDPDVKKNCLECIYLLAQDFPIRSALSKMHVVPPLLELLRSEYPVIQQLSLKALGSISYEADCRLALKQNQAMDHLLRILEAKELNDLHVEALLIIANCLEDADTVQLLQQSGGLKKILTFAETSPLADIQRNAAKAIATAAHNAENRIFFNEQKAEKTLLNLLAIDNDGVKTASLQAISAMCANAASKEVLGAHGIPQIILLLNKDGAELRETAAFALANLTTGYPSNASKVAEADGIPSLIHLLSDKRDGVVTNACVVLISMATQVSLRLVIQAQGVMNALVEPLQSPSNVVQSRAAGTVATMGCDADPRAEFRNAGGLTHLVKLLHSDYDEVRRSACRAIDVCANEELTTAELYRLGAYDGIHEIKLSASRRNNFIELALNNMLDNNLSLKYNQKGFLSYNNMINDGFYDHGRIKPDAKLPSLEELSKQELNQKRAVILINTKLPELKEKGKGKKEEEKMKEEDEVPPVQAPPDPTPETLQWFPPCDQELNDYIAEASRTIFPLPHLREQVVALAQFVAEKMGGAIKKEQLHEFSWELHISELKLQLKSNVIPIGKIKKGIFYHRALLYKAVADRMGIACTLERGDYDRAWNEVRLLGGTWRLGTSTPPDSYIVDLVYEPGRLMKQGTTEAERYQQI